MLIGQRLDKQHLLQADIVYDLEFEGRTVGRFSWRPNATGNMLSLAGKDLVFSCERMSLREGLAHAFGGARAKPFVLRDETGSRYAEIERLNDRTCAVEVDGAIYKIRKPWSWRHWLSICADAGAEIGSVRFCRAEGAGQIRVDAPCDWPLPMQAGLIGVLHELIARNQSSGD